MAYQKLNFENKFAKFNIYSKQFGVRCRFKYIQRKISSANCLVSAVGLNRLSEHCLCQVRLGLNRKVSIMKGFRFKVRLNSIFGISKIEL